MVLSDAAAALVAEVVNYSFKVLSVVSNTPGYNVYSYHHTIRIRFFTLYRSFSLVGFFPKSQLRVPFSGVFEKWVISYPRTVLLRPFAAPSGCFVFSYLVHACRSLSPQHMGK